jgi:hypothetical protein
VNKVFFTLKPLLEASDRPIFPLSVDAAIFISLHFCSLFAAKIASVSSVSVTPTVHQKHAPAVPAAWRAVPEHEDGSLERNIWEITLALAVRDALRAGDLNLADSRSQVSFCLVNDEKQWANQRLDVLQLCSRAEGRG